LIAQSGVGIEKNKLTGYEKGAGFKMSRQMSLMRGRFLTR